MLDTKLFKHDWDVDIRLAEFGTTKKELLSVVHASVGGRADAVPHDPVTAAGTFSYIYGTREIRNIFSQKGWIPDSTDNIESIINPQTGTKIIFQNAESAANDLREPKAISSKGAASERVVRLATKNLFSELEEEDQKKFSMSVWYFFVSVNGEEVTAELSRPFAVVDGQFSRFLERIYILNSGEWDNLGPSNNSDDLDDQDFEITVTRK